MTEPAALLTLPEGLVTRYPLRSFRPGSPVLMAIGAHPDDETMLAGGILAFVANAGFNVEVVSVTRGEGGEVGEPPVTTQDRLGAVRSAELRGAAERLGATGLTLLPFRDPLLAPGLEDAPPNLFRIDAAPAAFQRAITEVVRVLQPAVLLTHGSNGEYGHPQHIYTHETVKQVFDLHASTGATQEREVPRAPVALYTWAAYFPVSGDERLEQLLNEDDPADWLLRLRGDVHDRKAAAAECHQSQHDLFRRHSPGKTIREIASRPESLRRLALHGAPAADPLDRLLRADDSGQVRWLGGGGAVTAPGGGDDQ